MITYNNLILSASLFLSAAASVTPSASQTSVPGLVFDRYVSIWLENTDFSGAAADPNFIALTRQGIQLTNFFAVTHPSQPNYISSVVGEYFGLQNDNLNNVPANVSTLVDLLEDKGISWAEYEEDMPSTGFQGLQMLNAAGANDYVRKHNPLITYDSVATNNTRTLSIKNFTLFQQDLAANRLPQWMFITPNMTNDGHDTNVTFASKWANGFLTPLLKNPNFNGPRTHSIEIDTLLLGSAIPSYLVGTTDASFYTHYSELATIEANWNLHTPGRYDVGVNVYSFVANATGDVIRAPKSPTLAQTFLNASYPGILNANVKAPMPIPNTKLVVNQRSVLPKVVSTWGSVALQACTVYSGGVEVPSLANPPVLPKGC